MIVKDCHALIEFRVRDCGSTYIYVSRKGYLDCFAGLKVQWFPVHGRDVLLREINRQTVLDLGDQFRATRDIANVQITRETERDEPEPVR